MNKKSENNINTQRILKSKYLDRDKQKTIPLLKTEKSKNKIKLVDLCPQEKLKIGELIKTLETRRIENEKLRQEIELVRSNLALSQQEAQRLSEEQMEKQRIVTELNQEVKKLKEELEGNRLKNEELSRTVKEYVKILNRKSKARSESIQTQAIAREDKCVGMQIEVKSIDTQTQKQQQRTRDLFYRPHSKSFEKIMKGTYLNLKITETHPHEHSQSQSNHTGKVKESIDHSPSPSAQNEDQFIQQLHQKWDQLKAKNRNLPNNSPHSFNASTQKESSRKKSRIDQIDQISLNKMLRLKDFSASKLMKIGKEINSQSKKEQSPEINYLKSPYFNRLQPTELSQNKKQHKDHQKKSPPNSEQPINFYQSGLFE